TRSKRDWSSDVCSSDLLNSCMSGRGCPKNRVAFRTASVVEVLEDIVSFPYWCESTHLVVCFTMDQRRSYSSTFPLSLESYPGKQRSIKQKSKVIHVSIRHRGRLCSPAWNFGAPSPFRAFVRRRRG